MPQGAFQRYSQEPLLWGSLLHHCLKSSVFFVVSHSDSDRGKAVMCLLEGGLYVSVYSSVYLSSTNEPKPKSQLLSNKDLAT